MAEIRADLVGDSRSLVKSIDNVGEALEEAADDIEKLEKEGDQVERSLESNFRDIAKDAKKSGEDVGRDFGDGLKKSEDGFDDIKEEANATAKETAASFDGSAESIVGAFQEIAANAFGSLGPAGAVAGLAAAAGIGLATAGFTAVEEARALSEERIADWADAYIEAGNTILTAAQIVGKATEIATDPEQYKIAAQNAKDWGVDEGTALRAMAGDTVALEVVRRTLNDRTDESNRLLAEQESQVDANAGKAYDLADAVERGAESFATLSGEMESGRDRASKVSEAMIGLINDAEGATKEVDELGNAVYTLPDGTQIMVDAETGQATTDISNFKGDVDGIPETVTSTVYFKANTTEVDAARTRLQKQIDANLKITIPSGIGKLWN